MDCSLPGSSVLGMFQARILEWVAMSPPGNLPHPGIEPGFTALQVDSLPTELPGKPLHVLLLLSRVCRVQLCVTPEMAAHQAPPSLGFSRQEPWSGLPFPSPMHERKSLSPVRLLATPWTAAYQAPPSVGFPRQEYWSGVPLPSPLHVLEIAKSVF